VLQDAGTAGVTLRWPAGAPPVSPTGEGSPMIAILTSAPLGSWGDRAHRNPRAACGRAQPVRADRFDQRRLWDPIEPDLRDLPEHKALPGIAPSD